MSISMRNNFIFVLLNGFLLFDQFCKGHEKRKSTAGTDQLQQLQLSMQSLQADVSRMHSEIADLHNQMHIKDTQISGLSTRLSNVPKVAFMAEISGDHLHPTSSQNLVYDQVYLNYGNGYHRFHGNFIAPVSGLYEFSMGVTAKNGATIRTHVNMKKNGSNIGYLFFDWLQTGFPWLKESESILVELNTGDEVWVQVSSAMGDVEIATNSMHTYFSGYLISS